MINIDSPIKVFRGSKKGHNSPGRDLGEKFRVELPNTLVMESMLDHYPDAEVLDSLSMVVRSLNIYFISNEISETFPQDYICFKDTFRFSCDRVTATNAKGDTRPCKMAGQPPEVECTEGCQRSSRLYFYIKEMVDYYGDFSIACLNITSVHEWYKIPEKLEEIKSHVGSLKDTDWPSISGMIPFTLSREKVSIKKNFNGTKKKGDFYAVKLSIYPTWYQTTQKYKQFLSYPEEIRLELLRQDDSLLAGLVETQKNKIEQTNIKREE